MGFSTEALPVGLITVVGGVLAWFLAAVFDYVLQDHRFKQEKRAVEGRAAVDPDFKATIGDIDEHLTALGAPPARAHEAALRNAVQPLLVLAIVSIGTFRVWTLTGWIVQSSALLVAGLVIGLTVLHELKGKID